VIDLTVGRVVLHELLTGRPRLGVGEVNRLRRHQPPVAAEVRVRLFRRHDQKVFVGETLSALKVDFLLLETLGPGSLG
jgi:hypothetical protein